MILVDKRQQQQWKTMIPYPRQMLIWHATCYWHRHCSGISICAFCALVRSLLTLSTPSHPLRCIIAIIFIESVIGITFCLSINIICKVMFFVSPPYFLQQENRLQSCLLPQTVLGGTRADLDNLTKNSSKFE